jgi:dipeptidase D
MQPLDLILKRFEQVSSIPRGTKHEAGIRQWLIDWASAHSLKSRTDAVGNLAIYVPASAGYEKRPTLILQGHLDMVWQKTPDSNHDFTRDPIYLVRDGDWLKADSTTLGADNGIAIAFMMALAEDETIAHPPLELLLTVEEEFGLTGADNLDPILVSGKTLINLDSEDEGALTVGCAGGGNIYMTLPVTWKPLASDEQIYELKVSGLQGGHSGGDINKHRGNANKLIARVLDYIQKEVPIRLIALKGGTARNAIPRDAEAVFAYPKEKSAVCRERFSIITRAISSEHERTEQGLSITLFDKNDESARAISQAETEKGIRLLMSLPNGVAAMSAEIPGFVETSNNIGIVELKEEGLFVVSNHRSSVLSRLEEIMYRVESLALLAGLKIEKRKITRPWQPNMDSPLLKKCIRTYETIFGVTPNVELTHGGLECQVISDRCGGLDTISLGPTVQNAHSPDERLYIPSIPKVWALLTELLKMSP